MLRQPLEVAARGEDQARFSAAVAIEELGGGEPSGPGTFAFDDARLPIAGRAERDVEERVEAAHRVELGHPAGERREGIGGNAEDGGFEQQAERLVGDQGALKLGGCGLGWRWR